MNFPNSLLIEHVSSLRFTKNIKSFKPEFFTEAAKDFGLKMFVLFSSILSILIYRTF